MNDKPSLSSALVSREHSREQVETLVNRNTVFVEPNKPQANIENEYSIRLYPLRKNNMAVIPAATSCSVGRTLNKDGNIRVGRLEIEPGDIIFNEKVVSRYHAEFQLKSGEWFVRDVGSSSGTFVNNTRLSPSGQKSEYRKLDPGDVIRFGVDYRGGQEAIYRAVSVKLQLNGESKKPLSDYQSNQLDVLNKLASGDNFKSLNESCAICLQRYKNQKALFMSPCGHMWHYKCIKSTMISQYPLFECVICRKTFDLEEESDDEEETSERN